MGGEDDGSEERGDAIVVPPFDLGIEVYGVSEKASEGGEDIDTHDAAEAKGEKTLVSRGCRTAAEVFESEEKDGNQGESRPDDPRCEAGSGGEMEGPADEGAEGIPKKVVAGPLRVVIEGEEGVAGRDTITDGGSYERDADAPIGGADGLKEVVANLDGGGLEEEIEQKRGESDGKDV